MKVNSFHITYHRLKNSPTNKQKLFAGLFRGQGWVDVVIKKESAKQLE